MADRFYVPVPFDAPVIELSREEAQHLAGVLRKRAGDVVEVFDGCGTGAEAIVETASKRSVRVRITRRLEATLAASPRVELATAVPKGDRARWLVEKATELGADVWTPLALARSVVEPGAGKLDKLRQTVIAACKQCGRNRLLDIGATQEWEPWLAEAMQRGAVLVAHPDGAPLSQVAKSIREAEAPAEPRAAIAVAIGPEGGFTDEEIAAALASGATLVNLGPHILRIETATIAALAWLRLGGRP